jgi:hypothetical protein
MAESTPAATVQRYIDAFNAGDADDMAACFAAEASILDGMAPHTWVGSTAAADWYRDVLIEGEHFEASGYHATLGEPAHDVITGHAAYFVAPAGMTFKLRDRQITQTGATFTFALRKEGREWRISAWGWAKGKAS